MGHTFIGDGFREHEVADASFAGVAFIGFFDSGSFAAFAQNDGRNNADELDSRFIDDRVCEAVDREGADDRFAIEGNVGVDEVGGGADQPRCQSQWSFTGPFGFAAFGSSAQGDGRGNPDELDVGFPCDREGQTIDGEGAHNRLTIEGDIGVDERGGLASKGSS